MRSAAKILLTVSAVSLASVLGHSALAATVSGSITGPDGKPFMGAFVVAENMQNQMTVSVLSDEHGRYHISNLPAASYKVQITATGFASDPRTDMRLAADEGASIDFTLRTAPVALGRSQHLAGPTAPASYREPRSQPPGQFLHHLLAVLPLIPEAHGPQHRGAR